ncbi:MAG: DUF4369 domain-containing protein [Prevotellaceae bacterium]|nr:DUF4369 domain-containing protein [Prevotellaceae bacterium]
METTVLSGEIAGLGDDTLYVYGADNLYDHIDTVPVAGGKFSITLSADTLSAAWLLFGDSARYPLFFDKEEQISVKGSIDELHCLQVAGNADNEALTAFNAGLKADAPLSQKEKEERAAAFIGGHPTSLASVYLLERWFVETGNPDFNRIRQLVNSLAGVLKDRPYVEALTARVDAMDKAARGKIFANFRLPGVDGEPLSRSDFKDQYLLIQFWASWDSLSRAYNALYRHLYKREAHNPRFALLGVSLDIDTEAWKEAVSADTLDWVQVCDFGGWETDIVKQLSVTTLPYNVLLSPSSRIEGRNLDKAAIEEKLEAIKHEPEKRVKSNTRTNTLHQKRKK